MSSERVSPYDGQIDFGVSDLDDGTTLTMLLWNNAKNESRSLEERQFYLTVIGWLADALVRLEERIQFACGVSARSPSILNSSLRERFHHLNAILKTYQGLLDHGDRWAAQESELIEVETTLVRHFMRTVLAWD